MPIITFTASTVFLFTSSSIPNDNYKGEIGFINKAMLVKYLSTDCIFVFHVRFGIAILIALGLNNIVTIDSKISVMNMKS